MTRTIDVTAAVIRRDDGRILLARRRAGKAFAHRWEFPGGKIEAGETPEECLMRELREELSIEAAVEQYLMTSRAVYPDLIVELHAYAVRYLSGELKLTDHDAVVWAMPDELATYEMPEPDVPIVEWLMAHPNGNHTGLPVV